MDMDLDSDWEVMHPIAQTGEPDNGRSQPTDQPADQPSSSKKSKSKKKQKAPSAAGETTSRTSKKAKKGKEARRRSSHAINLDKQCAVPLPPRHALVPAPASASASGPGPGPGPGSDGNNHDNNMMMDVSMEDGDNNENDKNDGGNSGNNRNDRNKDNTSTTTVKRCTRALTCKSHSFGAKRAVAGRSAPFDILLKALVERRRVRTMENDPVLG